MFSPPRFRAPLSKISRHTVTVSTKSRRGYQQHSSRSRTASAGISYVAQGAVLVVLGGLLALNGHASDKIIKFREAAPVNTVCGFSNSGEKPEDTRGDSRRETPYRVVHATKSTSRNAMHEEGSSAPETEENEPVVEAKELFTKGEPLCFVIGTGIDASHNEFEEGQILQLSDPSGDSVPTLETSTFHIPTDVSEQGQGCWAHETKVASVIAGKTCGVAPGTKLVDVRVAFYDSKTNACTYKDKELERRFKQIKAYLSANPETCAVINLSMGSGVQNNIGTRTGCVSREEWTYPTAIIRNPEVDQTIRSIYRGGALVIASSGNGCSPAFTTWPASNPYVLAVGALDRNGKEDEVSNFGATLLARGVDVRVAYLPPNKYDVSSGTSYAAPYVAGMACMMLAKSDTYPGLRSAAVRPGGLKSLLLDRFVVGQQGRTQPEHLRRRSDGEAAGEEDENQEANDAKGGGDGASGDKAEDVDTTKPIDTPDPDNTKEVKVEGEDSGAEIESS